MPETTRCLTPSGAKVILEYEVDGTREEKNDEGETIVREKQMLVAIRIESLVKPIKRWNTREERQKESDGSESAGTVTVRVEGREDTFVLDEEFTGTARFVEKWMGVLDIGLTAFPTGWVRKYHTDDAVWRKAPKN